MPALQVYRERFQPSQQLERPYAMVGVNVIAAETDAEARRLFTSAQQQFTNLIRGTRGQLPPPIDDIDAYWSEVEKEQASKMLVCSFVGSAETIRTGLERFLAQTGADELIVATAIYDHAARLRSTRSWQRCAKCSAAGRRIHDRGLKGSASSTDWPTQHRIRRPTASHSDPKTGTRSEPP